VILLSSLLQTGTFTPWVSRTSRASLKIWKECAAGKIGIFSSPSLYIFSPLNIISVTTAKRRIYSFFMVLRFFAFFAKNFLNFSIFKYIQKRALYQVRKLKKFFIIRETFNFSDVKLTNSFTGNYKKFVKIFTPSPPFLTKRQNKYKNICLPRIILYIIFGKSINNRISQHR